MKFIGYLGYLGVFLLFTCNLIYCWINSSGHGLDLGSTIVWFVTGLILVLILVGLGDRKLGLAGCWLAILGIVFALAAKPLGVMTAYDEWLALGMPVPGESRALWILGFAIAGLLGTVLLIWLVPEGESFKKRASPTS